jgi:hypothetical protein
MNRSTYELGNRAPSALSIRSARDSPAPRGDSSNPGTPRIGAMPPLSRTPSTNTVTQSKVLFQPSAIQRPLRHQGHNAARKPDSPIILEASDTKSSPISSTSDSSTSEESIRDNLSKSHAFRRPHRFSTKQTSLADVEDNDDDDDDDDDEPTFVSAVQTHPERGSKAQQHYPRHGDTGVSRDNRNSARNKHLTEGERDGQNLDTANSSKGKHRAVETTESSTGSLSSPGNASSRDKPRQKRIETLSPKPRNERRGTTATGIAGESDGTPSMGSSFSDLDGTYTPNSLSSVY